MFIGSMQQDVRAVIAEIAEDWKGLPVYAGCSGNFTLERVLRAMDPNVEVHSNDIALYSCAIGQYLVGKPLTVTIRAEEEDTWGWLGAFLEPGIPTIATLLICGKMFEFADKNTPYHRRMFKAYVKNFVRLHEETVKKAQIALDGMTVNSFYPGDVWDFFEGAPVDSVVTNFPPTYSMGYERLYKKIDAVFKWDAPEYTILDRARILEMVEMMQTKRHWCWVTDEPVEEMADRLRARVQGSALTKPVYIYGSSGQARITIPEQKIEPVYARRLSKEPDNLRLCYLTQGQMNTLRSEYLNAKITPATARINLALMAGEELIGAMAFDRPAVGTSWDVYMMSDFAIAPTPYPRLSKLVLAAVLSKEMHAVLQQKMNSQIREIGTTAFTEKAMSSKYRGLFEIKLRKEEGAINYIASPGRWTLDEALIWWKKNHGQKRSVPTVEPGDIAMATVAT